MNTRNKVFIAASLDGYIADRNGGLDWLNEVPNPDGLDLGYTAFVDQIDAIVMGRVTFETVCGFDCDWPYSKPVFVLSRTLTEIPEMYQSKAKLIQGVLPDVLADLNSQGYRSLYVDGGTTIRSFLNSDLIDDLIVSRMPVLLGGGAALFGNTPKELKFEHVETKVLLDQIVQSHYRRKR